MNEESIDRLPPYSMEAERAALGCMLMDRNCVKLAITESRDIFYDLRHQVIFESFSEADRLNEPTDVVSITIRLSESGKLDKAGGGQYLSGLLDATPTASAFSFFWSQVKDSAYQRELIRIGMDMAASAQDPASDHKTTVSNVIQRILALERSGNRATNVRKISDYVIPALDQMERLYEKKGGLDGISTGFHDLDKIIGGLNPPDYFVIGARPSFGKTSLAMNIAEKMAGIDGVPVGVMSLEMSGTQLTKRVMMGKSGVTLCDLRTGQISAQQFKVLTISAAQIQKYPIVISDVPMSLRDLQSTAREMVADHGIKVAILDYLQLAKMTGKDNRTNQVGELSNGIKALAKELNLIWIVLSQLSRDVEKDGKSRKPRLSDLRDSGVIEQDADIIGLLHKFGEPSGDMEDMELIIAKHRNGPTGEVPLVFDKKLTTFKPGIWKR